MAADPAFPLRSHVIHSSHTALFRGDRYRKRAVYVLVGAITRLKADLLQTGANVRVL
jgi:hypothetical protein